MRHFINYIVQSISHLIWYKIFGNISVSATIIIINEYLHIHETQIRYSFMTFYFQADFLNKYGPFIHCRLLEVLMHNMLSTSKVTNGTSVAKDSCTQYILFNVQEFV